MRGWYKDAVDCPPPQSRMAIATMTSEQVELYRHIPLPGHPISVGLQPLLVDDSIPEDGEIHWAASRLRLNRSDGPSGIRVEQFRQWLIDTTQDYTPDATKYQKVVAIVQATLSDGTLANDSMC